MLKAFLTLCAVSVCSFINACPLENTETTPNQEITAGALTCDANEEQCSKAEEPSLAACGCKKNKNKSQQSQSHLLACKNCK